MKSVLAAIALLVSAGSWATSPALKCDQGPANRTFGKSPWLVYGCNDGRSVVVVTAPGSPAMPFYFMFSFSAGAYHLVGEGTGSKVVTDAAYRELSKLTNPQIRLLYLEGVASAKSK